MYYAVQVKGGLEDKVMSSIKERVDPKLYTAVFTPWRQMNRKYSGKWVVRKERLYPGYIFVDTDHAKEMSLSLVRIPEFARMLGRDELVGDFVPLSPLESRTIDLLCDRETDFTANISEVEIQEGKIARILSGPLMGCEGQIVKVNLHKKQAYVRVEMFNQYSDVLLSFEIIATRDGKATN